MIPPDCPKRTPAGERDLFERLKSDPATNGWVVLHSLDIKKHQSKIEGELDLVVLVPGMGVLCLEVKGCDVRRENGKWIYPYEISIEGPFKQASTAMHSLRAYLVNRDSSLSGLLFFSAAIFTRVNFEERSPEWHEWQFINKAMLLRRPISQNITSVLERAHGHVRSKPRLSWYHDERSRPTAQQVQKLVQLLRDDFEYKVSPRNDVSQIEEQILRYTEEQFDGLDQLQENRRIIFKGPAGTGKTFLAIEAARRAAAEGKSVLLVCYNALLGDWLKKQTSSLAGEDRFQCRTFHSLLTEIAGAHADPAQGNEYWRNFLPGRATDVLLSDNRSWPIYDLIIVDEAQDLLREAYLDVLDLLLKGGLAGGNWILFGDFERQEIYLSDEGDGAGKQALSRLAIRAPAHVTSALRINCRNAARIAATVVITSGLVPGYKRVLHDLEGSSADPLFYSSPADQQKLLLSTLHELRRTFRDNEIIVLSMKGDADACAAALSLDSQSARLASIRHGKDACVSYASVHSFKGLEASAVILTDIERIDDDRSRALLYIGMSRARVRLFMLMHESCRSSYDSMLDTGLAATSGRW